MATHSSMLPSRISCTEESGRLHSTWGGKESDTTELAQFPNQFQSLLKLFTSLSHVLAWVNWYELTISAMIPETWLSSSLYYELQIIWLILNKARVGASSPHPLPPHPHSWKTTYNFIVIPLYPLLLYPQFCISRLCRCCNTADPWTQRVWIAQTCFYKNFFSSKYYSSTWIWRNYIYRGPTISYMWIPVCAEGWG